MTKINNGFSPKFGDSLIKEMRSAALQTKEIAQNKPPEKTGMAFMDHLSNSVDSVNNAHKKSEEMTTDLISGKKENIHETMLATTKADLSFKLMVQVRNKVLEAYNEVMRMPV